MQMLFACVRYVTDLLHYGVEREKQIAVDKIYYERADRLAASGIRMDKNDLKKMIC